ncbi:MAG: hypothetical protein JKY65_25125 [Planctomycetes bacterium]|nr:hypothetical protein [Planctomycetota bacterium]
MATLLKEVSKGLTQHGLEVEEDRGGLVVRGEPGGSPTSIWVNEAGRIVRAERVIAYPVDDFSELVGRSLDWLNGNRAGVSYSFQEAQRAIVARTCWSSPNRSPSPSQLHLLVALLDRAKGRDGTTLARVAEGDGNWDEVCDGTDIREAGSVSGSSAPEPGRDPGTLRFLTSRFDPDEIAAEEPATQQAPGGGGGGWLEPPTRAIEEIGAGSEQPETINLGSGAADEEGGSRRPTGGYSREKLEDLVNGTPPSDLPDQPATSRHAFQLAVQQLDNTEGHAKQDLTEGRRSPLRRVMRVLLLVAISIPIVIILFQRVVEPFIPEEDRFWKRWGEEILQPEQTPLELRRQLPMGRELLEAELRDPLEGSQSRIEGSLRVLGDKKRAVLEDMMIVSASSDLRKRIYVHWRASVETGSEPSVKLLKRITVARQKRPEIERYLRESIKQSPPPDPMVVEALTWSENTPNWAFFVKLLGRPGKGAKARAKALETQLPQDNKNCVVLRALIKTGFGSPDAVQTLIDKRGTAWCGGPEGRPLLTSLIKKDPDAADGLLNQQDRPLALLGVNLLREAKTADTIKKLSKVVFSRKTEPWVRERAAEALRGQEEDKVKHATWPLVYVLNDRETPASLRTGIQQTLKSYGAAGVAALERYTTRDRSSTRRYAVVGLGAMELPAATERLVARLDEETDSRLKLLVLETLERHVEIPGLRRLLERKLIVFRRLSQQGKDEQIRQTAGKLYHALKSR